MPVPDVLPAALLLVGPTGVGKSPLGDHLARHGLCGRACRHLDFGARLRAVADDACVPPGLTEAERAVVRDALAAGRLLTEKEWNIAHILLADALQALPAGGLLVLNGLPRDRLQAARVDTVARVEQVVVLEASAETLLERIRLDTGGDRAGRRDDDTARVTWRLARYEKQSVGLLAHYAALDVPRERLSVGREDTAAEMAVALAARSAGV